MKKILLVWGLRTAFSTMSRRKLVVLPEKEFSQDKKVIRGLASGEKRPCCKADYQANLNFCWCHLEKKKKKKKAR